MIYRFLSLIVVLGFVTACSSMSSLGSNSASRSAEGDIVTPGFAGFTDVPVPAGSKMDVEKSLVFGQGSDWTGRLSMTTSANIASTYDFYLNEMTNYGWRQITAIRADISVLTFIRGNRVATIALEPRSFRGTSVTFTVSPRGESGGNPAPSQTRRKPSRYH